MAPIALSRVWLYVACEGRLDGDVDGAIGASEIAHEARDGHDHQIVLALPEGRALLREHADDLVGLLVDLDGLADRRLVGEELLLNVGPNHGDVASQIDVFCGDVPAVAERVAVGDQEMFVRPHQREALNLRAPVTGRLAAVEHLEADGIGLAAHQPLEFARLAEHDVAAVGELVFRIAGVDGRILGELEDVAAEETEAALDGGLNHAQRRHHANDGKHADGHAQDRQAGTELVGPERIERHADDFSERHGCHS
jgi:hypothetical protein